MYLIEKVINQSSKNPSCSEATIIVQSTYTWMDKTKNNLNLKMFFATNLKNLPVG